MRTGLSEQKRQQVRQMDVESLATFVFSHLKENLNSDSSHSDFFYPVVTLRHNLFPDGAHNKSGPDHAKLLEAIGLLERRGLVVIESSYPASFFNPEEKVVIYFTSIGMKSHFDNEILILVDKPEEIVDALEQKVGKLDSIVRLYYLESLRAYQGELYISSVICLGAASERAIHWLAESIESNSSQYQKEIKKRSSGNILRLTKYLSDNVIHNIFEDNKELKDRLDGLAGVYRENRNEPGHPKNVVQNWSREDQEILLLQFRRYITTICKAISECHAKGESTASSH